MTVALITDSKLMPDNQVSILKRDEMEADKNLVNRILKDLRYDLEDKMTADDGDVNKTFVNSFIAEIKIENPPDDFQLNLFIKPSIDIVSKICVPTSFCLISQKSVRQ